MAALPRLPLRRSPFHGSPLSGRSAALAALAPFAALFGTLCALLLTAGAWVGGPAGAAAPFDHRPTAPTDSAEYQGAGYRLSDPSRGPNASYWAGAYTSMPGVKSYCIDRFYDYPRRGYGYVSQEVSSWPGRPGSNSGATGHVAQRLVWIVNSYGQSASRAVNAAVGVSVHRLLGGAGYERVYTAYYRPQLALISRGLPALIDQMLADSDRFAGPYSTRVTFGAAPPVGGPGQFAVTVRSAQGYPVRNVSFAVVSLTGGRLTSPATGSTGPTGVGRVSYVAARAGTVTAAVHAVATANTVRLGQSPTHSGPTPSTGSQRVLAVSATPTRPVAPGTGRVTVNGPAITTTVVGGVIARPVGTPVRDDVAIEGLLPGAGYDITAVLQDGTGRTCGTATGSVTAGRLGTAQWRSPALAACGSGTDTFTETLSRAGVLLARTPAGQPSETFPVSPVVTTQVAGGNAGRPAGALVADTVTGHGFLPGARYEVLIRLQDENGRECGRGTVTVLADAQGDIGLTSPQLPVCGTGTNTFVEEVRTPAGTLMARTPSGVPSETFPIAIPPAATPPGPVPTVPAVPAGPPAPRPTHPAATHPTPVAPRATSPAPAPSVPDRATPARLATTGPGSYRTAGVGFGVLGLGLGLLLMATARPPHRPISFQAP